MGDSPFGYGFPLFIDCLLVLAVYWVHFCPRDLFDTISFGDQKLFMCLNVFLFLKTLYNFVTYFFTLALSIYFHLSIENNKVR